MIEKDIEKILPMIEGAKSSIYVRKIVLEIECFTNIE